MWSLQQPHQNNGVIPGILRSAGSRGAPKVQEAHQDYALPTEAGKDAINLDAIKELRAALPIVRPMVEVGGVNSLVAPRVLRERQIIVSLMVEAVAVNILTVLKLHGVSLDGASSTVVGRDAQWKAAFGVLRGRLDSAFLMVVDAGASIQTVARGLRAAHCTVRHMAAARGVSLMGAAEVQRGAHLCAKPTAVGSDACLKVVVSAQRVYMGAPTSAWHMEEGNAVQHLAAPRAPVAARTPASSMVVVSVAGLTTAVRVLKGVQTSAKLTVEVSGAHGDQVARSLPVARVAFVLHMGP